MIQRSGSVRLLIGAVIAIVTACAPARQRPVELGPVDTGAGSRVEARKYLRAYGRSSRSRSTRREGPVALKGTGTLVYDDYGNLKMDIRADEASADVLRAAGIDIADGVIRSEGRTVVDLQHKTLTYVIGKQPPAGAAGPLSRPRHWQVEGDVLTLTTKDDAGNPLSVGRWRKAK